MIMIYDGSIKVKDNITMQMNSLFVEPIVYTRDEFCQAHRMSHSTFDRLVKAGKGPAIIKMEGKKGKVLISKEAAAEWRKSMEVNR